MKNTIVSSEWLLKNFSNKKLILLDASPISTVDGNSSPLKNLSIPSSRIFNIKKDFVDTTSSYPNTIPTPARFQEACQSLGINNDHEIVVFDNLGIYTSPRVWWMFKVMGHDHVKVLDGGLNEWIKQGGPTINKSKLKREFDQGNFKSDFRSSFVISYDDIVKNSSDKKFTIVDARSKRRFDGSAPEPRKHLQSGCIPHSINIPYQTLLRDGKFKSVEELSHIFESKVKEDNQLVFSCGSGLTACIVMLAGEMTSCTSYYLYDGSWTEYAEKKQLYIS